MATTQLSMKTTHAGAVNGRAVRGVIAAGLGAGMMMGMVEMIISAAIGQGFWAPPRHIASVLTRGADVASGFSLGPVVVGLMGHMINSVILTALFAVVVWKITRHPATLAALGMMWGAAVFAFMWWGVAPAIDPAIGLLNPVGFLVTHLIFGMVAGLGVAWARRRVDRVSPELD
jgi:hypothetical protein